MESLVLGAKAVPALVELGAAGGSRPNPTRGTRAAVRGSSMASKGNTNRYLLTGVKWEGHQ